MTIGVSRRATRRILPKTSPIRAAAVATSAPLPTSGIAAWILPTGNAFNDADHQFARPTENYGADISFVQSSFNDTDWRQLDLPHDFGIEGPFIPPGQAGSDGATGRLPYFGVAWYRKHLAIPGSDEGKQIYLDIDGAMAYTSVWLNGAACRRMALRLFVVPPRPDALHQTRRGQHPRHPARQPAQFLPLVSRRRHLPQRVAHQNRPRTRFPMGHLHHNARGLRGFCQHKTASVR